MGEFVDLSLVSEEPSEIVNRDLLVLLGLSNTHSTSNVHGLVKPALVAARDETVKVPKGPWTKELNAQKELETMDVWDKEPWILKMTRTSTLFYLVAKYRIACYLRRLAWNREVLRRKHLKKREIWRFLTMVHRKEIVLDERTYEAVEADLVARSFATNADLSLAFTGEEEGKEEMRPFSYLLDLPRSLSLSEKWHRLEQEVESLMA